jgi:hypothetical protein
MVYVSYYVVNYVNTNNQYFKNYNKVVTNELANLIDKQKAMDERIKEISETGDYTIKTPCLIVNPYGLNPLSAIVIFNTPEKTYVDVFINDVKVTRVEKSTQHIIPIYGLYSNSTNIIELKLADGTKKTLEIKTTSYNNNLTGIVFDESRKDYEHVFVLGNMKSSNSILRGFDSYNNLMLYMDFGYFSSIKLTNNLFHLGYNSIYSRDTELKDIELQIDYLGRVVNITDDTNELNYSYNAEHGDKIYSYAYKNLYEEKINNYNIKKLTDNTPYTVNSKLITKEIEEKLINAEIYKKPYKLAINGEYITYDFEDQTDNMNLILVTRNTPNSYMYDISKRNMIKTNITTDVSLFVVKQGEYYSLMTTINN